jgi:hypothetical protein
MRAHENPGLGQWEACRDRAGLDFYLREARAFHPASVRRGE